MKRSHFSFFLALLFTGCSWLFQGSGTPEAKQAVLRSANDFLTAVATGRTTSLQELVAWNEYRERKDDKKAHEIVEREANALRAAFPLKSHPLMDLTPVDIAVRGDFAVVMLRKRADEGAPRIEVRFAWADGGWLVIDDNIFGPRGIAEAALSAARRDEAKN